MCWTARNTQMKYEDIRFITFFIYFIVRDLCKAMFYM